MMPEGYIIDIAGNQPALQVRVGILDVGLLLDLLTFCEMSAALTSNQRQIAGGLRNAFEQVSQFSDKATRDAGDAA